MLKIPLTAADHLQGDARSPIVLVEYGDYECPHCGHAYPVVKQIQERFGDALAFVFRNFPLSDMHPMAEPAAEVAEFAATVDRFWEVHDAIFENQDRLSVQTLVELAEQLELPRADLSAALKAHTFVERIRSDLVGGARSGVNGTPTFFINGQRHDGSFEFEELAAAIEARQAQNS